MVREFAAALMADDGATPAANAVPWNGVLSKPPGEFPKTEAMGSPVNNAEEVTPAIAAFNAVS